MMNKQQLGELIKIQRSKLGLSQGELAQKCGWEEAAGRISNYENGSREPSISDLEKIAKALKLDLKTLLFGEDSPVEFYFPQKAPKVPHFNWDNQALDLYLKECLNGYSLITILRKIPHMFVDYPGALPLPEYLFSMTVAGDAMECKDSNPDSLYSGDRVYIDPKAIPSSYTTVFAKIDNNYLLRQFIQDGTQLLLRSLNSDYETIKLGDISAIKGVVTSIYREKKRN